MSIPRFVTADELRAAVRFEDLIEPVAEAFQRSSAGSAQNGLIVLFPGDDPAIGDVYVKSGVVRGEPMFIVKIAPWFAANAQTGVLASLKATLLHAFHARSSVIVISSLGFRRDRANPDHACLIGCQPVNFSNDTTSPASANMPRPDACRRTCAAT